MSFLRTPISGRRRRTPTKTYETDLTCRPSKSVLLPAEVFPANTLSVTVTLAAAAAIAPPLSSAKLSAKTESPIVTLAPGPRLMAPWLRQK